MVVINKFSVIEIRPNHVRLGHPDGYPVHCPYALFPRGIAAGDRVMIAVEKAAGPDRVETTGSDVGSWRDRPPLL